MAVTVTKNSNGNNTSNATSLTVSHVSDGNPLWVLAAFNSSAISGSGVTFNGVALTRITSKVVGSWTLELWSLNAPAATTANIVVTASATCLMFLGGYCLSGAVNPSDFTADGFNTATATSTAPSVVVPSRVGDLVLGLVLNATSSQTFTDAGGQTRLFTNTAANGAFHGASSTAPGAASVTFAFTLGISGLWDIVGLNIASTATPSGVRTTQEVALAGSAGTGGVNTTEAAALVGSAGSGGVQSTQTVVLVGTPATVAPIRTTDVVALVASKGLAGEAPVNTTEAVVLVGRAPLKTGFILKGVYSGTSVYGASSGSGTLTVQR